MKKVTNKLNLNESANEESIVAAIDMLEVSNKTKSDALTAKEKELKDCMDKYDALNAQYNAMKKEAEDKLAADKVAKETADAADIQNKAETLVSDAVKAFKIENKAEVIESYKKLAVKDFDGTKSVIESLAVNRKGANLEKEADIKNITPEAMEARPSIDIANPQAFVNAMNVKKIVANNKK